MEAHILDNTFWHILSHEIPEHATGTALAKRGDANLPVAVYANHSDAAFADLAALYQPGEQAGILEVNPPLTIPGFELSDPHPGHQLVCQQRTPVPEMDVEFVELTQADLPDIFQLLEIAKPGPFIPILYPRRRFVGIRQAGELVAMAGERLNVTGYGEISGICTHPDWRGRGYARFLTCVIADGIWERGETPYLHVAPDNTAAYRIYTALHFVKRAESINYTLTRV